MNRLWYCGEAKVGEREGKARGWYRLGFRGLTRAGVESFSFFFSFLSPFPRKPGGGEGLEAGEFDVVRSQGSSWDRFGWFGFDIIMQRETLHSTEGVGEMR